MYIFIQCSPSEIEERQRTMDVSVFESTKETCSSPPSHRIIDPLKAVTKYRRNAQRNTSQSLNSCRSLSDLVGTVYFLLGNDVLLNLQYSFSTRYSFIFDRFKAIRQDIVSYQLSQSHELCNIYEEMCRFYIVCHFRLSNSSPAHGYDSRLNFENLQSTLSSLLIIYESNTHHEHGNKVEMYCCQAILLVLSNQYGCNNQALNILDRIKQCENSSIDDKTGSSLLNFTQKALFSLRTNNWVSFYSCLSICKQNFLLCQMLLCEFISNFRFHTYEILKKAYPKTEQVSLHDISFMLGFDTCNDTERYCKEVLGLSVKQVEVNVTSAAVGSRTETVKYVSIRKSAVEVRSENQSVMELPRQPVQFNEWHTEAVKIFNLYLNLNAPSETSMEANESPSISACNEIIEKQLFDLVFVTRVTHGNT